MRKWALGVATVLFLSSGCGNSSDGGGSGGTAGGSGAGGIAGNGGDGGGGGTPTACPMGAGGMGGTSTRLVALAADYFGDRVSLLNLEEDPPTLTSTLNIQRPSNAAITSDGTRALITTDTNITVLNMTVHPPVVCATVSLEPVGDTDDTGAIGIAITPDDSRTVVTRPRSDVISILDLTTNPPTEMLTLPPLEGSSPFGVAITPDGNRALVVVISMASAVNVLDLSMTPPAFTESIPVGNSPFGIVITPDGTQAITGNFGNPLNDVFPSLSLIDLTVDPPTVETFEASNDFLTPTDMAITPDGTMVIGTFFAGNFAIAVRLDNSPPTSTEIPSSGVIALFTVAITPDGTRALVGARDGMLVMDLTVDPPRFTSNVPIGEARGVAIGLIPR